jgi:predicted NAD/FAD-binding protein
VCVCVFLRLRLRFLVHVCACFGGGVKMEENRCKVVVVGGGLAGLAAARMLSGYRGLEDVVVLEADSSLGGRIKHITGLAPWPVEV